MSNAGSAALQSDRLYDLVGQLSRCTGFAEVVAGLLAGEAATLDGVWGSSCALAAAALAEHVPGTLLAVASHIDDIDDLADDLSLFTSSVPQRFEAWEKLPDEQAPVDEVFGDRIRLLKTLLSSEPPKVVLCSIQSLLQGVPQPENLGRQTRVFRVGEQSRVDELAGWLIANGFHNTPEVQLPGEFSLRGGIVDVFAPDWFHPVRMEFFGDEIESIRRFEVATQRSLQKLESTEVTMLRPELLDRAHLADYLPPGSWLFLIEPLEIQQQATHYLQRLDAPVQVHDLAEVMRKIFSFPSVSACAIATATLERTCRLPIESVERFSGDINKVREELEAVGAEQDVYVVCQTEAETRRLQEIFGTTSLSRQGRLHFLPGALHNGFRIVSERAMVLSSGELFRRTDLRRLPRRRLSRVIDSFLELREGDLVVHVSHGIARYRGLKLLDNNGQTEEHLKLEFDGRTKLYVPSSKIGLVQKYVGGTKSRPRLAKLGGRIWGRVKQRAEQAVADLASEMLELQAARCARPGIAFPHDTQWQLEFDASFPYQETADQISTIDAIKQDMLRSRPMDRLLCGDVGYGKTEVAMRAAFKAVDAGYQVAILVPTTVLCGQHLRTFTQRMAEFPFEVASLSRFSTRAEQAKVLQSLESGTIDIVIGTHRLAQPDVRFHNLGLVIIDEEQRFGVEVKERLKTLRQVVDV
ncbi:MAG: DEAD/DEAH box helicase, partial [Thermoguttaceae bacterium]